MADRSTQPNRPDLMGFLQSTGFGDAPLPTPKTPPAPPKSRRGQGAQQQQPQRPLQRVREAVQSVAAEPTPFPVADALARLRGEIPQGVQQPLNNLLNQ